jgi:hypothetical protein
MAQVTILKVVEGNAHVVIRVNLASLGVGELENTVILSPSDLVPVRPNTATAFRIMQIWSGLSQFDVTLGFDTTAPVDVWTLVRGADAHVDFRSFGGLMDYATAPPAAVDGKLWISTLGFNVAGLRGSLVLELRKTSF